MKVTKTTEKRTIPVYKLEVAFTLEEVKALLLELEEGPDWNDYPIFETLYDSLKVAL